MTGKRGALAPYAWPLIPEGDPPQFRAVRDPPFSGPWKAASGAEAGSWHSGCMVTQGRSAEVAYRLFPGEATDGSNCRGRAEEHGALREIMDAEGNCLRCAEHNQMWADRVTQVRRAMLAAFS